MSYPICADCAHLIGVRSDLRAALSWKCGAPENVAGRTKDPVSGLEVISYLVQTCREARGADAWCGLAGKWHKPYEHPAASSTARGKAMPSAESLLGELGL